MYTDFEFAGKRLSDFGYTICKFGGSSDLTDVEIGCDITFSTVKNNHSSIHYNTSSSYENVYTTSLEIMKNPCNKNQEEMYHVNEEISMLTAWLNRREYHKFKPLTETDNFYSIHYYGSFNVREKTINDRIVGFVLTFTGNAPYGFGEQIINEIDMKCNDITASGEVVTTTNSANAKPKNIKLFGKSIQNGTPSIDNEVAVESLGESGSIGGKVLNSNIIDYVDSNNFFVKQENGKYLVEASETVYKVGSSMSLKNTLTPNQTYYFACGGVNGLQAVFKTLNENGEDKYLTVFTVGSNDIKTFKPSEKDVENAVFFLQMPNNVASGTHEVWYSFNVGESQDWQPYTEQPFTVLTPNGLKGIDNVRDYIDFANKKRYQYVFEVVFDGSNDENWVLGYGTGDGVNNRFEIDLDADNFYANEGVYPPMILCNAFIYEKMGAIPQENHFRLAIVGGTTGYMLFNPSTDIIPLDDLEAWKVYLQENPVSVYIPLAEPIITDLTDEEMAEYNALVMNYPNTTIVNDAGAYMEVAYLQDYDNKFVICGDSDEYKTMYPNISITCKRDGDLRIKNSVTGNIFEILNCSEGETIYVNGEHKFIDSDNEIHKSTTLFNDFNYNYLDIDVSDDDFSENVYETSIPCKIVIDYSPIRKVGV